MGMDGYIVSGRIGEGAHGIVLKGVCKTTLQIVALKRIALKNIGEQGLPNSVCNKPRIVYSPIAT